MHIAEKNSNTVHDFFYISESPRSTYVVPRWLGGHADSYTAYYSMFLIVLFVLTLGDFSFGVKEIDGVKRLSGPRLSTEHHPGVTQSGGRWPSRYCF